MSNYENAFNYINTNGSLKPIISCYGPTGPTGPRGDDGEDGTSVTILGRYNDLEELEAAHPEGNEGDSYLIDLDLYVWDIADSSWEDAGEIKGPKGDQGDQGETGPEKIRSGYFVTLMNNIPAIGYEVASNGRLPISRKEIDNDDLFVLDANDNTIQFNKTGTYKIDCVVNSYVNFADHEFNPSTDFVSVGFRKVDDVIIFAGGSAWVYNESAVPLSIHGMFVVTDISEPFELVNMTKRSIYLNNITITNTTTDSYFIDPLVTIVINYLG